MTHTTNNPNRHSIKTIYITLAAAAILSACTTAHRQQPTGTTRDTSIAQTDDIPEDSTMYNPGVLIINYTRTDTVRAALLAQVNQLNATVIYDYNILDAIAVRLPEPHTLSATNRAIQALKSLPGILAVERDRVAHLDTDR